MKEGYYWYFGTWYGEDTGWFVVEVQRRGDKDRAYIGEESKPVSTMPGRFVYIEQPAD